MATETGKNGRSERPDERDDIGADGAASGADRTGNGADASADADAAIAAISRQGKRTTAAPASSCGPESEPAAPASSCGPESEPAVRARARSRSADSGGSKSGSQKSKKGRLDLNAEARKQLARQVCGVHKLAGIAVGAPALVAITDEQSEELTNAALDVMQHYDMSVSPAVAAWANLAAVCATIYAPKFLMFNALRKQARAQQQPAPAQPASATVFDFSAGGGGAGA